MPTKTFDLSNSIRVDVVALPEKVTESTQSIESKPAPAEPIPLKSTKQTKADQKRALEKLKAMESLEKIKEEVRSTRPEKSEAPKPMRYKGQVISSGSSFTGLSRLRVNEYLENLTSAVRNHWELPQWLSSANLKTVVVVSVDARGVVVKNDIYASSGNSVFDASCLAAVGAASPFEPPPDEVREALLLIRFPFE